MVMVKRFSILFSFNFSIRDSTTSENFDVVASEENQQFQSIQSIQAIQSINHQERIVFDR